MIRQLNHPYSHMLVSISGCSVGGKGVLIVWATCVSANGNTTGFKSGVCLTSTLYIHTVSTYVVSK